MDYEASPEVLAKCIQAISQHPKGKREIVCPPGQVYGHGSVDSRMVYINFVRREEVAIGDVYRTWIVELRRGVEPRVSFFLSRRGEHGDDTLPPD